MAIEMHMPVSELLSRFTSYEIREIMAFKKREEYQRLEETDGVEGTMARARKHQKEQALKALKQEMINGDFS